MQYYIFSEATNSYVEYEPTPVAYTDYFELPSVDLYSFDVATNSYYSEPELSLSPFVTYFSYEPETEQFNEYIPTQVSWTDYFEPSVDELYYYEPSTMTF